MRFRPTRNLNTTMRHRSPWQKPQPPPKKNYKPKKISINCKTKKYILLQSIFAVASQNFIILGFRPQNWKSTQFDLANQDKSPKTKSPKTTLHPMWKKSNQKTNKNPLICKTVDTISCNICVSLRLKTLYHQIRF